MSKEKLASLTALAEALAQAKRKCRVKQSEECLSLLQDVQKRVWPYVHGELAETNAKLSKEPYKSKEDDSHRPDIYRAELKKDLCGKAMYFVDLTESNSEGMLQDLAMVSEGRLKLQPKESKAANCEELVPKDSPQFEHDGTFVLVRNPLERFISGYAAIERSLRQTTSSKETYSFLNTAKSNGTERARLFLNRFFEDGANYSSHVSSMADYIGGMAKSCQRLPMKYFAKVEHARMNWKTFLKRMECDEVFNKTADSFELMSKSGEFKHSMNDALHQKKPPFVPSDKTLWDATTPAKLLQLKATESSVAGASHMMGVLGLNNFVYLRAFCWLNLADYIMFEYELPLPCHREDMDVILKLTEEKVQSKRLAAEKENKQNDAKQKDGKQQDGKHQDGKHKDGKQKNGKQQDGQQQDGKHQDGKHKDGKQKNGKQQDGQQQDGKHQDGKQKDGKHQDGKQKDGKQKDGKQKGGEQKGGEQKDGKQKGGEQKGGKKDGQQKKEVNYNNLVKNL
eukprot:Skav234918  [mRNA]  locus=scaffold840:935105:936631:+ [translate_table: standard]